MSLKKVTDPENFEKLRDDFLERAGKFFAFLLKESGKKRIFKVSFSDGSSLTYCKNGDSLMEEFEQLKKQNEELLDEIYELQSDLKEDMSAKD